LGTIFAGLSVSPSLRRPGRRVLRLTPYEEPQPDRTIASCESFAVYSPHVAGSETGADGEELTRKRAGHAGEPKHDYGNYYTGDKAVFESSDATAIKR
jgi:hypothetical protein